MQHLTKVCEEAYNQTVEREPEWLRTLYRTESTDMGMRLEVAS